MYGYTPNGLLKFTVRVPKISEAEVRHDTPGKINISTFPAEIVTSKWETSLFSYHNNIFRSIRILESSAAALHDTEIRTFLSRISLITEMNLVLSDE